MITQTLNYLFMKKILSYLYFGVPELCSRNHLIFLRYIMFRDSAPHDNCMVSIHENYKVQETTAMAASISLVEQALHSSYISIYHVCVSFPQEFNKQTCNTTSELRWSSKIQKSFNLTSSIQF